MKTIGSLPRFRFRRLLFCVLFPLSMTGTLRSQEMPQVTPAEAGLSAEKLAQVKTLVQGAIDNRQTAGAVVLVARKGKIAYLEALGKLNAATGRPMTADAIFRLRSMSKPITTAAALLLLDEGKFKLADPVSQYFPEWKGLRVHSAKGELVDAKREMTIRDLMRHTSGLGYGMSRNHPIDKIYIDKGIDGPNHTLAEMVTQLGGIPLLDQPGEQFRYSVSTDVLARLIEVVSGKPIDQFLQERLFLPLDMKDTGFLVPEGKIERLTALYQQAKSGELKIIDNPVTSRYRTQRKYLSGGGGLVSTARDFARFCQMLLNQGEWQGKRLLRPETVKEMMSNQLPAGALPMRINGFPLPGMGFGLGGSVRLEAYLSKTDPAGGEFAWSGASSTNFSIAPRPEMIVIILQQVEPQQVFLPMLLQSAIYGAIEK